MEAMRVENRSTTELRLWDRLSRRKMLVLMLTCCSFE
jgi:hypothetical protein